MEHLFEKLQNAIDECDDLDFEYAIEIRSQIERDCWDEVSFQVLAEADVLIARGLCDVDALAEAEKYFTHVKSLHHSYPDNPAILNSYAKALLVMEVGYITSEDVDMEKAVPLQEELIRLAQQYPAAGLQAYVADGHYRLNSHYLWSDGLEEATRQVVALKKIYGENQHDPEIARIYFNLVQDWACFYLSIEDTETTESCLRLLAQIREVSPCDESYPFARLQAKVVSGLIDLFIQKEEIEKAVQYCKALETLCSQPDPDGQSIMYIYAEEVAEIFNYYHLAKQEAESQALVDELKRLADTDQSLSPYYARTLYARCSRAISQQDLEKAEQYSKEVQHLYNTVSEQELADTLVGTWALLADAYMDAGKDLGAERLVEKMIILEKTEGTVHLRYYLSVTLLSMVISYQEARQFHQVKKYVQYLQELAAEYPDEIEPQSSYLEAIATAVNMYDSEEECGWVDEMLGCLAKYSLLNDWTIVAAYSKALYNIAIIYSHRKNFLQKAGLLSIFKELTELQPAEPDTVLRYAKLLYTFHYEYSDNKLFVEAERIYQELNRIYQTYATSTLTITDGSLLALEMAKRVSTASLNYAIDLHESMPKKRPLFSFNSKGNMTKLKITALIAESNKLASAWQEEDASVIHANLKKIRTLRI